MGNIRVHW